VNTHVVTNLFVLSPYSYCLQSRSNEFIRSVSLFLLSPITK
jgi:hypothetical protein